MRKHAGVGQFCGLFLAAFLALSANAAATELPTGRALEQVSPQNKNGGDAYILGTAGIGARTTFVSPGGDRLVYDSYAAFVGAPSGYLNQYLAVRSPSGWENRSLTPVQGIPNFPDFTLGFHSFACSDCSTVVGQFPWAPDARDTNKLPDVYTSTGEGSWSWISQGPLPNETGASSTLASSADGSMIGFDSTSVLEPEAQGTTPGDGIAYVSADGQTRVVALDSDGKLISPGGSSIGNPSLSGGGSLTANAISADGSKVFFTTPIDYSSPPHIYVREDDDVTHQLDVPQCTRSGCEPATSAEYLGAAADGSKVFFLSNGQLVNEDTDSEEGIYEYDLTSAKVSLLAPSPGFTHSGQSGFYGLLAYSEDGSMVYADSTAVLTTTPNAAGVSAQAGDNNTYLIEHDAAYPNGRVVFLGRGEGFDFMQADGVSPNGRYAILSGDGDYAPGYAGGTGQYYLYDAVQNAITCISCGSGTSPQNSESETESPGGPDNEGDVLFATPQALVPHDDNGIADVYLWHNGRPWLLSSGHSAVPSEVLGMSRDGQDMFFVTSDRLLPGDTDDNQDVYDARLGGVSPVAPPVTEECGGEGCQGAPAGASGNPSAGSITFVGPGNGASSVTAGAVQAKTVTRVRLSRRAVQGAKITLTVTTPGAGKLTLSGAAIGTRRESLSKGGAHTVTVSLTERERRVLAERRTMKVGIRAEYRSSAGEASTATLTVTVKA